MVPVTNDEPLRASCGGWDAGHLLERTGDMLRKTTTPSAPQKLFTLKSYETNTSLKSIPQL